ncbi:MAG TPA: hypothetical protein IAB40_05795 [Candidatus Onthocola stercoravium]|nr:hypothetical protein [Candidatus Onthocola stercoravium]
MLSITKDLETSNGLKASKNPWFVFLTPENVEDSYKKIMDNAPFVLTTDGKYSLMFARNLNLIDEAGNVLDIDGKIIDRIGKKYFVIAGDNQYKIMNANGQVVIDNLDKIDYVGEVISFQSTSGNCDVVVTPDTVIIQPINTANVVKSLLNGYYIIKDSEDNSYALYDTYGNILDRNKDIYAWDATFGNATYRNYRGYSDTNLYEKAIISEFQRFPELCDYEANNLLDMLVRASSLDEDYYIDLKGAMVYQTKFTRLLKISDGKRDIWVPDTEEEMKVIEDFCLKRRKTDNE